ncbi:MAG TPA: hypothetical protein VH593_16690, partial [Ktedonobacteraceae bacterium]
MGNLLALHGGLFSGKTTLAKRLTYEGFALFSYTDLLKEYTAKALTACGIPTTLDDILADKERFRTLIIALGTMLDFDHGFGIREHIPPLLDRYENIVFDNVRFSSQMDILAELGFRLVRITTPEAIRRERAFNLGYNDHTFAQRLADET